MKSYWANLQPRERRVLTAGAVALLLIGIYALAWEPYRSAVANTRAAVESKRTTLAWMQQAAEEVRSLRGSDRAAGPGRGGQSLLALVDATAKSNGLADALKRVQPDGQKAVRVWLEGAPFDAALVWMGRLYRDRGLRIDGLVIEQADKPGRANLRLTLEESA